ncbi:MAG TPA: uracil-DNA glycosylase family protein, partial [Stellaceae bacterium]
MTNAGERLTVDKDSAALAMLRWYVEMGADEAIGDAPVDRFAQLPAPAGRGQVALAPANAPRPPNAAPQHAAVATTAEPPQAYAQSAAAAAQSARTLAARADSVEALEAAIAGFEGCALKRTATSTVIADGNPTASVMIIGEAPGADEDRIGRPFVGRA